MLTLLVVLELENDYVGESTEPPIFLLLAIFRLLKFSKLLQTKCHGLLNEFKLALFSILAQTWIVVN